jgi:thioredoxin-related protein
MVALHCWTNGATMNEKKRHPHFDDKGTLSWHTRFKDALAQAKAEDKHVFIEMGREACGQCRTLVQSVVPRPDVAPLLQRHFIALASDADDTEDEVIHLASQMEDAMMLPFVILTDKSGRFVSGSSGMVNPVTFAATLKRITQK